MTKLIKRNNILRRGILPLLGMFMLAAGMTSCDNSFIYDDTSDCFPGVALRFVYDYHMERGANSFPANVDCVNVFVMDTDGNYITHFTETSDRLKEESYRMILPLEEGEYHLLVYGGLACDKPSFKLHPGWLTSANPAGHKDDILVKLPVADDLTISDTKLHDTEERTGGLFYGTLDITIDNSDWRNDKREETVYMMKDTNNIQVILQELASPYQIDEKDYHFYITDDNFVLDGYNNPVHISTETYQPTYLPYNRENRIMGYVEPAGGNGTLVKEDESRPVQVAAVEFSTSRLFVDHLDKARLVVTTERVTEDDGSPKKIIDIPLITYLTATKGFGQNWIKSDQEYLDRQSNWNLMFFLVSNVWVNARVAVNSWIVRVNDVEL